MKLQAEKRRAPTEREKRAATCLLVRASDGRFIIAREEAQTMTPAEILREFDRRVIYAHGAHRALGGSMHPTNLWPTRRDEDAKQTPKDIGAIAKTKRIRRKEAKFNARMLAKAGREDLIPIDVRGEMADGASRRSSRAWPSRPFPKRKASWPKRPFPGSKADRARRRKP